MRGVNCPRRLLVCLSNFSFAFALRVCAANVLDVAVCVHGAQQERDDAADGDGAAALVCKPDKHLDVLAGRDLLAVVVGEHRADLHGGVAQARHARRVRRLAHLHLLVLVVALGADAAHKALAHRLLRVNGAVRALHAHRRCQRAPQQHRHRNRHACRTHPLLDSVGVSLSAPLRSALRSVSQQKAAPKKTSLKKPHSAAGVFS